MGLDSNRPKSERVQPLKDKKDQQASPRLIDTVYIQLFNIIILLINNKNDLSQNLQKWFQRE